MECQVEFQKTRASQGDPCSRFYRPTDFQLLAVCLHACTEEWNFVYWLTAQMDFHTSRCPNHLSNNVKITDDWIPDPSSALALAVGQ
jgi:hypothetical protein